MPLPLPPLEVQYYVIPDGAKRTVTDVQISACLVGLIDLTS